MKLKVEKLSFAYDKDEILKSIGLDVDTGEFIGIIGPNGCGKSTLLKNLYGVLKPSGGCAYLNDKELFSMDKKELAVKAGVVGQESEIPFDFSVQEIVAMGRTPHKRLFQGDTVKDREIVKHALEHMGLLDMADRSYKRLSGGEKQRTLLARVMAQESEFLFLDEPTNHLDVGYQVQIFDLVKRLGLTVLSAIHDLNMAALYCDRIFAMKDGCIVMSGTPKEVLSADLIYELYGVRAEVTCNSISKHLSISYIPESIYRERKIVDEESNCVMPYHYYHAGHSIM